MPSYLHMYASYRLEQIATHVRVWCWPRFLMRYHKFYYCKRHSISTTRQCINYTVGGFDLSLFIGGEFFWRKNAIPSRYQNLGTPCLYAVFALHSRLYSHTHIFVLYIRIQGCSPKWIADVCRSASLSETLVAEKRQLIAIPSSLSGRLETRFGANSRPFAHDSLLASPSPSISSSVPHISELFDWPYNHWPLISPPLASRGKFFQLSPSINRFGRN